MKVIPLFTLTLLLSSLCAKEIDLVKLGHDTFHSVGCAECHSEIKDDTAVKTGPGLYGLFQKPARDHTIVEAGENHRHTLKADLKYLKTSLSRPHAELAINASNDEAYLPVMPPYDQNFIPDQKARAIYQYLLTLNDKGKRGPTKLLEKAQGAEKKVIPERDPAEILVTDHTRIFRPRLSGSSARAIAIGTPSGLNYLFDPRSLSIERIWWGGFLNLAKEFEGRAKVTSDLGHQARELPQKGPLFHPLHPTTNQLVDLSFKSPVDGDFASIAKNLQGKEDFIDQLKAADADFLGYEHKDTPVLSFRVGPNQLKLQFTATADGKASVTFTGKLAKPQSFQLSPLVGKGTWTITELPATREFTLPAATEIWRPTNAQPVEKTQKAQFKRQKKIQLPKGYQAEAILPPLDTHGRPQLFEPMGMDTAPDGSLIITTRTAGVWRLHDEHWTQLADGTLDALGVIAEEDALIVAQKPELTRMRDTDDDGIMDQYETLTDDFLYTSNYHEYLHGPAKDSEGNYYIHPNLGEHRKLEAIHKAGGKYMGSQGGFRGWALKVSPTGTVTPFAHGLRSPAGLATGPDGQLYYTENQGEYVGTSKLFLLKENVFYGHPSSLVDLPGMKPDSKKIQWDAVKKTKEEPLALFPHSRLANSPGSPVWDTTGGSFGPFTGQMFVGDQTRSNIFRVIPKTKNEAVAIPFGWNFPSGVMRLCFGQDGSLYAGQTGRGWRAKGGKQAALVRIFRDGNEVANQLIDINREGDTFSFKFTRPLKTQPRKYNIRSWYYIDSPEYGSKEHGMRNEKLIASPSLSADRKTLSLHLKPRSKQKNTRIYHFQLPGVAANQGNVANAYYTRTKE